MDLYVVAADIEQVKRIWPSIKHRYINHSEYRKINFTGVKCAWSGLSPKKTKILLCGEYWRNPSLETDNFKRVLEKAAGVFIE
ncbi:hypothetical protein SAMN04487969_102519 [Paenibacillus algorifonticola]|uniref:Uncharacterized protein n=1 Tax=Paenibacillus algorifonticola TaxID=684063 RepID=A0A1I2AJG7_9BACL|nr:hypothetical protein [Paenibacillus algorifonticola]SFE43867.1 hypothetical protein SAMN04487969_102519 [Paenibacillus algorifonticola]